MNELYPGSLWGGISCSVVLFFGVLHQVNSVATFQTPALAPGHDGVLA